MGRRAHARLAGKVVLSLYREVQPRVEEQVAKYGPSSCKKGCNACCRLLTLTDLPQMVPVVEYLSRRPDWEERKPELLAGVIDHLRTVRETGLPQMGDQAERATTAYWELRIPCVFLTGGVCSVYQQRPGVCRYYEVVTPAEDCNGPSGTPVASVDLRPVTDRLMIVGMETLGELCIGTIPAMFAMACRALGVDFPVPDELLHAGILDHAKVA